MAAFEGVLADLLARSPLLSGRELATAVYDAGRSMGLTDSAMYVADLQQIRLIALPLPVAESQRTLDIDTSLAGPAAAAVVARLDTADGVLTWTDCGHPAPLLIRAGRVVRHALEREPGLPLGWGFLIASPPTEHRQRLQPGDRILVYSDGVTEARSPDGDLYGEQRLADTVIRAIAAGDPAPEALRRLVQSLWHHQDHKLRDDATILLIEWHPTAPGESAHRG
ncbi:PP2C family protein-serine/threonine phosphatase [Streptomyces sp. NPDC059556]|uniref:PP2C family protein-serine/threonine phosphatase n=1 Tax=Streptomyces sp. NPDC059556 TaxID=3346863 RepID=UPI0036D0C3A9